ncbi:MAG: DUF2279 domain-containing protein, partial [Saprospiraceae bacterium]|nr:DUF2279 domain-containing protein [Saprospiraceae bacterium]
VITSWLSAWQKVIFGSFILFLSICPDTHTNAQNYLMPSDTFNRSRFLTLAAGGTVLYGATVVGLNKAWYKGYDRSSFHFFNDWGEWNNLDKTGHLFTSYFETELSYRGCRWIGINEKKSRWLAAGLGLFYQSTIEFFDAYSERWGFSIYDMAFNIGGTGIFFVQEQLWNDQRIRLKVSSWPKKYSPNTILANDLMSMSSLRDRTDDLFGTNFFERYLKDYNAQTIWVSFNINAFIPEARIPPWLNIAVGYGSKNLYGGFSNTWKTENAVFTLPEETYPRLREWYLAPDIDFRKIKTQNALLKTLFNILNIFKIPSPAIEYNSQNKWKWHWIFL